MPVDIDQLREDRRLTAAEEGWTAEERREIDAAIKAAIDAGDEEALECWARDLAFTRELRASYAPRLREFERRVKAEGMARQPADVQYAAAA